MTMQQVTPVPAVEVEQTSESLIGDLLRAIEHKANEIELWLGDVRLLSDRCLEQWSEKDVMHIAELSQHVAFGAARLDLLTRSTAALLGI